jgi:hypothetical protein
LEEGEVVEEVGEALLIKGSSAFMSSWSEEEDLSWFVYKSRAAITKRSKRLRKTERRSNLLCKRLKWMKKQREKSKEQPGKGPVKTTLSGSLKGKKKSTKKR